MDLSGNTGLEAIIIVHRSERPQCRLGHNPETQ